jgi:DNA-binding NarL/FixJ family response regulator
MAVRVAIQDRQRFFREGLAMVLGGEPDVEVVAAVATASEVTRACEDERPDVVLLELDADEWDACRLAAALRKRTSTLRVIGVANAVDRMLGLRAYQAGIRSVVPRGGGVSGVLTAIRSNTPTVGAVTAMPPVRVSPRAVLTARELDVLGLVGAGHTTREVSEVLGISPKTVENHKQRIFVKLGVQNQAHAVAVAMRTGLLHADAGLRVSGR